MLDSQDELEMQKDCNEHLASDLDNPSKTCSDTQTSDNFDNQNSQKVKLNREKWTLAHVTKMEALVMFLVILLISTICIMRIYDGMQTANLEHKEQIGNLLNHIQLLEAKLDVYSQNKEPLDITVNIDGIKQDGDTSVGDNNDQNTTGPNFDTSPFLGVGFNEGNTGLDNPLGLKVNFVYQYSPADLSGMKAGDIIMSIDGEKINVLDDLDAIIAKHKANDKILIEFATATEDGINVVKSEATLTYRGNFELEN